MSDNETNLDPFAYARDADADADAEIFALRAELTALEQHHTQLYEQMDALPCPPYEPLPASSLGRFYITSDYERAFASCLERRPSAALEAERDRVLAACRARDARIVAAEEAAGISALERERMPVLERLHAVRDKMMTTRAKTLAGLQIQLAEFREELGDEDGYTPWLNAVIASVREIAEREARA
jgi:hypothetical protein